MFEDLFTRPRTIERYQAAPLAEDRLRYLIHSSSQGAARFPRIGGGQAVDRDGLRGSECQKLRVWASVVLHRLWGVLRRALARLGHPRRRGAVPRRGCGARPSHLHGRSPPRSTRTTNQARIQEVSQRARGAGSKPKMPTRTSGLHLSGSRPVPQRCRTPESLQALVYPVSRQTPPSARASRDPGRPPPRCSQRCQANGALRSRSDPRRGTR